MRFHQEDLSRDVGRGFSNHRHTSKLLCNCFRSVGTATGEDSPALQMLDTPETLEAAVYHDGHAGAQGLALLHAVKR